MRFGSSELILMKVPSWIARGVLVGLLGCAPAGDIAPLDFELEQVGAYGTPDFDSASAPALARESGGSMLAAIAGVVQTEDGSVFVLDQQWLKVAVFSAGGELQRVFPLRRGAGPGEFRLPVHMVGIGGNQLAILDYGLSRVVLLDETTGEHLRTISLEVVNPMRLVATSDQLWVLQSLPAGSEGSRGVVVDLEGNHIAELPPLSPDDRPFGASLAATTDQAGRVLISTRIPGRWYEWHGPLPESRGSSLVGDLAPPRVLQEEGMTTVGSSRATPAGLAVVGEDRVAVRYWTTELDEAESHPVPGTQRHFLGLFDLDGQFLGQLEISDIEGLDPRLTYGAPWSGHIFVPYYEPFPQVREFRISETR